MLWSLYRTNLVRFLCLMLVFMCKYTRGITSCCTARSVCILRIQGMSELTWLAFSSAGLTEHTWPRSWRVDSKPWQRVAPLARSSDDFEVVRTPYSLWVSLDASFLPGYTDSWKFFRQAERHAPEHNAWLTLESSTRTQWPSTPIVTSRIQLTFLAYFSVNGKGLLA